MDPISVNEYLDNLNEALSAFQGRVVGEIVDIQLYPGRSYMFFKIKDKDAENPALLSCFMWRRDYVLSGVKLEAGMEVIVSGTPSVYKPLGRISLNVRAVELVGEGELKKAYDKLKARLEKEGVFSDERKRPLPVLPQKIGLVTSKDGAAIGDFQVNLGRFGFKISFIDSRVEGQLAVAELLTAIRSFRDKDIEVLVLVRGGGSLESLLPFNNEALIREIVDFPVPVLVGVGHEKDISLIGLAADKMVSTPTAAAQILNESWQQAVNQVQLDEHKMFTIFSRILRSQQSSVQNSFQYMRDQFKPIFADFNRAEQSLLRVLVSLQAQISDLHRRFNEYPDTLKRNMRSLVQRTRLHIEAILRPSVSQLERNIQTLRSQIEFDSVLKDFSRALGASKTAIISIEKILQINNPERQLRLGYSIVRTSDGVVRSVDQVQRGQKVEVRVQDGSFESDITKIVKSI